MVGGAGGAVVGGGVGGAVGAAVVAGAVVAGAGAGVVAATAVGRGGPVVTTAVPAGAGDAPVESPPPSPSPDVDVQATANTTDHDEDRDRAPHHHRRDGTGRGPAAAGSLAVLRLTAMELSEADVDFIGRTRSAAMITVEDGVAKAVRVGVGFVDGKLWSSGTADRVRTARLRRDPRCTLYVHDDAWSFLGLETTVTILEGPDIPEASLRLFRELQGRPTGPLSWFGGVLEEDEFLRTMVDEQRVIYEFDVLRAYGLR